MAEIRDPQPDPNGPAADVPDEELGEERGATGGRFITAYGSTTGRIGAPTGLSSDLADFLTGKSAAAPGIPTAIADFVSKSPEETRVKDVELHERPSTPVALTVRAHLDGADPAIWRRLELSGELTLAQLHGVLQAVFAWQDEQPHAFIPAVDGRRDLRSRPFANDDTVDVCADHLPPEDVLRIDEVLAAEGDRLFYEYGIGRVWNHTLRVERIAPDAGEVLARCREGAGAAPPEEMGTMRAYGEALARRRRALAMDPRGAYPVEAGLPAGFDPEDTGLDRLPDLGELLARQAHLAALADALGTSPLPGPAFAELIQWSDAAGLLDRLTRQVADAGIDLVAPPEQADEPAAGHLVTMWQEMFAGLGEGRDHERQAAVLALLAIAADSGSQGAGGDAATASPAPGETPEDPAPDAAEPEEPAGRAQLAFAASAPEFFELLGWSSGSGWGYPSEADLLRWSAPVWRILRSGEGVDAEGRATDTARAQARAALLQP